MKRLSVALMSALLLSCSGGSGGDSGRDEGSGAADFDCSGGCANQHLTEDDVRTILSNAQRGALAMGAQATIAVVDRVGNVLALYQMAGAAEATVIDGGIGAQGGLEGSVVASTLAAISKAGTGAYLSSQGNSFSTRTASQIIQEHFNPSEERQPGGPLFGVQFSQLLCSDITVRNAELADGRPSSGKYSFGGSIGPRAMPLGLSADPGGFPLYKNGDVVGGVGIEFDGIYRLDRVVFDRDTDPEEVVAMIATLGFEAPSKRVAPNMNLGKSLRYSDISYEDLPPLGEDTVEIEPARLIPIPEFFSGTIRAGAIFGTIESGVAYMTRAGVRAMTLVTPDGMPRYPIRAGSSISIQEVEALLDSTLLTAQRTRAAIRRPLDSPAAVSIWVVDELGNPLGFVRSVDAPVFGIDVALQKARGAALASSPDFGAQLRGAGLGRYADAAAQLLGEAALQGRYAFADRAIGNLSRPYFPDGIDGTAPGPFSLPFPGLGTGPTWSPFNNGLQFDLVAGGLLQALDLGGAGVFPSRCSSSRALNGIQIFPGSVPLYRDGRLIGAIGVSGDGVDQDDLIAFYGASRRGLDFAGHGSVGDPTLGFNAPIEIRSDTIPIRGYDLRLRFVNCPEAPFIGSNEQNVCDGL